MYGDGQRKGFSTWDIGPATEPQLKQMYHGLGGAPVYHYTGNPVSWLVTLSHCIPFLKLNTGEQDMPLDQSVSDDLSASVSGGFPIEDTGSNWTSDPSGAAYENPQGGTTTAPQPFNQPVQYQGFSPSGVPMGTIHGRMVPLYGSRKTYSGG